MTDGSGTSSSWTHAGSGRRHRRPHRLYWRQSRAAPAPDASRYTTPIQRAPSAPPGSQDGPRTSPQSLYPPEGVTGMLHAQLSPVTPDVPLATRRVLIALVTPYVLQMTPHVPLVTRYVPLVTRYVPLVTPYVLMSLVILYFSLALVTPLAQRISPTPQIPLISLVQLIPLAISLTPPLTPLNPMTPMTLMTPVTPSSVTRRGRCGSGGRIRLGSYTRPGRRGRHSGHGRCLSPRRRLKCIGSPPPGSCRAWGCPPGSPPGSTQGWNPDWTDGLVPDLVQDLVPDLVSGLTPVLGRELAPDCVFDMIPGWSRDFAPDLIAGWTQGLTPGYVSD